MHISIYIDVSGLLDVSGVSDILDVVLCIRRTSLATRITPTGIYRDRKSPSVQSGSTVYPMRGTVHVYLNMTFDSGRNNDDMHS
jgi:hypothetical protein